jgi:hypothetical protein
MKTVRSCALVAALACAPHAFADSFTLMPRVLSHTQAAGTGPGVVYSSFGLPTMNESGDLVFIAPLSGPGVTSSNNLGLWHNSGQQTSRVLRTGDAAPSAVGNGPLTWIYQAWIADTGRINVFASWSAGQNRHSLFTTPSASSPDFQVILDSGANQPPLPPGISAGWTTSDPYSTASRSGIASTQMRLQGTPSSQDSGLWVGLPGNVSEVAITRSTIPGPNPLSVAELGPGRVNSQGQVVFHARSDTTVISGNLPVYDAGVWLYQNGSRTPVLRVNDPAPGMPSGTVFSGGIRSVIPINDQGQVLVKGVYRNAPGPGPSAGGGLWVGSPGNMTLAARGGQQAPGLPAGQTLRGIFAGSVLGEGGHVAFIDEIQDSIPNEADRALWLRNPSGQTSLIVRLFDHAPGEPANVMFRQVPSPLVNSSGALVLLAELGIYGSTINLGKAIFAQLPGGPLEKVVKTGDTITIAPGDVRTVSFLDLWQPGGDPDRAERAFTDSGILAFRASFTNGTSAIMTTVIPAPGAIPCLAMFGVPALRRPRRCR